VQQLGPVSPPIGNVDLLTSFLAPLLFLRDIEHQTHSSNIGNTHLGQQILGPTVIANDFYHAKFHIILIESIWDDEMTFTMHSDPIWLKLEILHKPSHRYTHRFHIIMANLASYIPPIQDGANSLISCLEVKLTLPVYQPTGAVFPSRDAS
jgi:hypothetical protein